MLARFFLRHLDDFFLHILLPYDPIRVHRPSPDQGHRHLLSTAIWFPQLLGNGKDVTKLAFSGQVSPIPILILLALKPLATVACFGSGAPGGLFTPSLYWARFWAVLGDMVGLHYGRARRLVCSRSSALARSSRPRMQGSISAAVLMNIHYLDHLRAVRPFN